MTISTRGSGSDECHWILTKRNICIIFICKVINQTLVYLQYSLNVDQNVVSWLWLIEQSSSVSEANSNTIHFIVVVRLAQDLISRSHKKSSKHFVLGKFEIVSGLHFPFSVNRPTAVPCSQICWSYWLLSHVFDAECSGSRNIITSGKKPSQWVYCTGKLKHWQKYPSSLFNFNWEVKSIRCA